MEAPPVEIVSDKSDEEISEIMGDLLRESVFVFLKDVTDRTSFIASVSRRNESGV